MLRNTIISSVLSALRLGKADESEVVIQVFTSAKCEFSDVAIGQALDVVENLANENENLRIVETSVDRDPSLLEQFNIIALPLTVVNDYYIVGVPSRRDLESIINKVLDS